MFVHVLILLLTGVAALASSVIMISFSGEDELRQDRTVDRKSMIERRDSECRVRSREENIIYRHI